jgi:hypothetical protein
MFTNYLNLDFNSKISTADVSKYLALPSLSSVELVPSLIWGSDWSFTESDLEEIDIKVSTVQSIFYNLPLLISEYPSTLVQKVLWHQRLAKLSLISAKFPHTVFILGGPKYRKLGGSKESIAMSNQSKYIRDILNSLDKDCTLGYENCNPIQGSEFCLGIDGAIGTVKNLSNEKFGLNFDFEAWVLEVGINWKHELGKIERQLSDIPIFNIQMGKTATDPEAMYFLKMLSKRNLSPLSIEDSRIDNFAEVENLVRVFEETVCI